MASTYFENKAKSYFRATGADTDGGGITVTQAAPSNALHKYAVTDITASGDAAALVTVESPASTVLWRIRFAAAFTLNRTFDTPIIGADGQAILIKVSAGTTNTEATIAGYSV